MIQMKSGKKNKWIWIIAAVILVAAAVITGIVSSKNASGYRTISIVETFGTVGVVKDGIEYRAYAGMLLQEGHELVTSEDSYVRLVLDGDKYVKLESGSRAVFETLGLAGSGKTCIRLERGAMVCEIVNPLEEDDDFVVNTPNAVLAVRGTLFRVDLTITREGEVTADILTYGGKVATKRVLPNGEAVPEEVLIDAGYKACINMNKETTQYVVEDEEGTAVFVEPETMESMEELPELTMPIEKEDIKKKTS